jgi:hypothetical protein
MHSGKVGGFRPVARAGVVASSIALLAMRFSPNAVLAAIIPLGTAAPIVAGEGDCSSLAIDYVQAASVANNYVVSQAGTITSWNTFSGPSTAAAPTTGPVGLQVWRPAPPPAPPWTYSLVGSTTPVTLTPDSANGPFPASIAVNVGDVLGLRLEGAAFCSHYSTTADDKYGFFTRPASTPMAATERFTIVSNSLLNVTATLDTTPTTTPPPPSGCDAAGQTTGNGNDNCKQ